MSSTMRTPWPSRSAPHHWSASQIDGRPKASPAWMVTWKLARWMSWNASRWRLGGKPASGPAMSKPDHALVAVAHGQLGDLHRARELAHGGHDRADHDGMPGRGCRVARHARKPGEPRRHDLVERQPALRRELGRVAHLGVDDAIRGQVLGALGGDALDRLGRLHHADRVRRSPRGRAPGSCGRRPAGTIGRARRGPWSAGRRSPSRAPARSPSTGRRPPSRWSCRSTLVYAGITTTTPRIQLSHFSQA